MDRYKQLYITRLSQWRDRLFESFYEGALPLKAECAVSKSVIPFDKRKNQSYKLIQVGEVWGKEWDSSWFHITGTVPSKWQKKKLVARIDIGSEGLVFDKDGVPQQAITDKSVFMFDLGFFKRQNIHLAKYKKGNKIELWIEGSANGLFGVDRPEDPSLDASNLHGTYRPSISKLEFVAFDQELWEFMFDVDVLFGIIKELDETQVRHAKLLQGLMDAAAAYADKRENLKKAKIITTDLLKPNAVPSALTALSVGHAHIDTAWLWPVSETIRKCARTFSSQIDLLERYPDYIFGASAPQHYLYTKTHYPKLYEKIKKYVKAGRWELQGGMWIEADCNLPSGESLVRQFIHGKNFFRDEFGIEVDNLWIPDVFGYSAALPQIMKKSGVDNFLTQKISWSQFNGFPHHSFMWQGIDGTQVLTHFPPEDTYNSLLAPDMRREFKGMILAEKAFIEKGILDQFMVLYGVGDGGGGPTDEMIERGRRMSNIEGTPKVKFGTAKELFKKISPHKSRLAKWVGELYLEYHRGTLTTQAKVKKFNRKIEFALQELEKFSVLFDKKDYPRASLDLYWKNLLLNQFHDIIPGSSIHKVYEVAHQEYQNILDSVDSLRNTIATKYLKKNKDAITVFNSHSYDVCTHIKIPKDWRGYIITNKEGQEVETQDDVAQINIKQHEITSLYKGTKRVTKTTKRKDHILENALIRYEFNSQGKISKIYDKIEKKIISADLCNVFTLYEDRPHTFDAWDIDVYYENCVQEVLQAKKVGISEVGALFSKLEIHFEFGNSTLTQEVILKNNSSRLDFKTTVDWNERHSMLRVSFPVNIQSKEALYDIQYGYYSRPTHRNTSWDKARFEVCGHKFADLSDEQYGVALLNDCKYGYKVFENILDLCLLRSPTHPDPIADRGEHSFTYSLFPHAGKLIESDVMKEATDLNQSPRVFVGFENIKQITLPLISNNEGISLDVIKRGEKNDSIYLRLVERKGLQATCNIIYPHATQYVETDMLEWKELGKPIDIAQKLSFTPFEIKTIKLIQ